MQVKILIPSLNEGKNIAKVVNDFKKYGQVIVCNNNSSDNTAEQAKKAGAKVIFQKKIGYGYAYQELLKQEADIYIIADGDGAFYAKDAELMIKLIKNNKADLVSGRRINRNKHNKNNILLRKIFLEILNFLFYIKYKKYTKKRIPDYMSGFKAFNKKIKNLNLKSKSWGIETELTIKALKSKAKIIEIPIQLKPRMHNKQKSNSLSVGYNILKVILSH